MNTRIIMSAVISFVLLSVSVQAEILNIASEENWIPYAVTEDGEAKGFSADLIRAVLDRMETPYTITPYPWKRALSMVMDGKAAGLYNASPKPDRAEKCFYPTEPLVYSQYVFFILKERADTLQYESFDDLQGHTLGMCDGYSYSPEFLEFAKTHDDVIKAPDDEILLKMLSKGRVDFFPAEIGNGMAILKKLGLEDTITYLPKPLLEKPYYVIFNKERVDQAFVDEFSQTLKAFKETPEFKAIYDAYF